MFESKKHMREVLDKSATLILKIYEKYVLEDNSPQQDVGSIGFAFNHKEFVRFPSPIPMPPQILSVLMFNLFEKTHYSVIGMVGSAVTAEVYEGSNTTLADAEKVIAKYHKGELKELPSWVSTNQMVVIQRIGLTDVYHIYPYVKYGDELVYGETKCSLDMDDVMMNTQGTGSLFSPENRTISIPSAIVHGLRNTMTKETWSV